MNGYIANIETLTIKNEFFRQVLFTTHNCQLVVMALLPGQEIGTEIHSDTDQFFRIESGSGTVVINGVSQAVEDGSVVIVPAGIEHNVINTGVEPLKLYTLYMPPHHRDGVIHKTQLDALSDDEHFDGVISG